MKNHGRQKMNMLNKYLEAITWQTSTSFRNFLTLTSLCEKNIPRLWRIILISSTWKETNISHHSWGRLETNKTKTTVLTLMYPTRLRSKNRKACHKWYQRIISSSKANCRQIINKLSNRSYITKCYIVYKKIPATILCPQQPP